MFWVVGASGRRYHVVASPRGGYGQSGWLPMQENTGVPPYLPAGAKGLLGYQGSFEGEDGDGDPIQVDFGGERAEIR